MKHLTFVQVQKMRKLITDFLDIANKVEEDEWIKIIKSIREEKEQLQKISNFAEMGAIFIVLFVLNEILESVIKKNPSK